MMAGADDPVAAEKIAFPVSGAFSSSGEWLDGCMQELQQKQQPKVLRLLNGYRVTTWRLCVEKRRKQIADMIGATGVELGRDKLGDGAKLSHVQPV